MDFGTRIFQERKALRIAARRLGVPAQDVDDVVSRTFVRALELADRYEEQGTLRAWLVTVMRGLVLNDRRMAQTRRTVLTAFDDEEDGHEVWREAIGLPASQETGMAAAEALEVIAGLPQDWRDVVEAVTIEGLSYADYAAARGLTLGTVKSRLSRAITEVRARLEATGGRGAAARSGSAAGVAGAAGTAGARRKRRGGPAGQSEAPARMVEATAPGVPAATAAQGQLAADGTPSPESAATRSVPMDRDSGTPERLEKTAPEHRNGATPDRRTAETGKQGSGVSPLQRRAEGTAALADRRIHDLQRLLAERFGAREGVGPKTAADAAPLASARQDTAVVAPDHGSAGAAEHGPGAPLIRGSGARAEHGAAALAERENVGAGDADSAGFPPPRQAA